jgi:hypothetical protein
MGVFKWKSFNGIFVSLNSRDFYIFGVLDRVVLIREKLGFRKGDQKVPEF